MQILSLTQYSDEWWEARCGLPTSSSADKIVTPKTGAISSQSVTYMNKLLAERRGIVEEEREPTEWMKRGHKLEGDGRVLWSATFCADVREVGLVLNDDGTAGCSPDGLVYKSGEVVAGLEIKCPKACTHIGYLLNNELPPAYKPQVHMSMFVAQVDTWHFMSYHPNLQPLFVTVHFDQYTKKVGAALTEFCAKLESEDKRLAA